VKKVQKNQKQLEVAKTKVQEVEKAARIRTGVRGGSFGGGHMIRPMYGLPYTAAS